MQEMTGALAEAVAEKILVRTGAAPIVCSIDIDTTSHLLDAGLCPHTSVMIFLDLYTYQFFN